MVLCGGDPAGTGVAESEVMQSMLDAEFAEIGALPPPTLLDTWSRTTVGNATFAARLLKQQHFHLSGVGADSSLYSQTSAQLTKVLLVSSEFHLPRAKYFFEAVFVHNGITCPITACPAPTPQPDSRKEGGINSEPLARRIAGERRYLVKIDDQLERHFGWERETLEKAGVHSAEIATYGPARPLSAARNAQARHELESIPLSPISICRLKDASAAALQAQIPANVFAKLVGKQVTFIRHAQSIYNIHEGGGGWLNEGLRDAALSPEGCMQAASLANIPGLGIPELLVSSPLTRAIQTAALGFGSGVGSGGSAGGGGGAATAGASTTEKCTKLTVCNLLGEKIDAYSDLPQPLAAVLANHAWVASPTMGGFAEVAPSRSHHCKAEEKRVASGKLFTMVGDGKDRKGPGRRPYETSASAKHRIAAFWKWLADRKEASIVVVTHSKILGGGYDGPYGLFPGSRFANVEVKRVFFG
jgi:hypothetical protein